MRYQRSKWDRKGIHRSHISGGKRTMSSELVDIILDKINGGKEYPKNKNKPK